MYEESNTSLATCLLHDNIHGPNVSTTPLRQWGFRQCLPFSWTTLRGKHCRHPIAVMGVVDTLGQQLLTLKFIYSEKATKFCEIFTLLLTTVHTVKSKVKISQNFVAFSEYMNFKTKNF